MLLQRVVAIVRGSAQEVKKEGDLALEIVAGKTDERSRTGKGGRVG